MSKITLTNGQQDAVEKIGVFWDKYGDDDKLKFSPVFRLAGYAGTGKSTCISSFINETGLDDDMVATITFTGRAALVLRNKGHKATTIHKLIYRPVEREETYEEVNEHGQTVKKKRTKIEFILKTRDEIINGTEDDPRDEPLKLIVIDEASMVSAEIYNDLVKFNLPIIAVYDPGQLPPVFGKSPILSNEPDVFLTEIMRQALDNPIVKLSMWARDGRFIPYGNYDDKVLVISKNQLTDDMLLQADIVLATTHKRKDTVNKYIREELLGRTKPHPMLNDKLIFLKNNWEITNGDVPIINGLIGTLTEPISFEHCETGLFKATITPDGSEIPFENIECNLDVFNPTLDRKAKEEIIKAFHSKGIMMDSGYCITVHKSQGGEFPNVVFFADLWGDGEMRKRLLYTAITRASEKLIIVR